MAPSRRAQPPPSVSVPDSTTSFSVGAAAADLPPISALFLIDFDVKAGYTIAWKQSDPDLELDGTVEYKSLPSGLHTVSDDLIYFIHGGTHAGLSAFVNEPCEEEEARNARMIAVGILVPLSYGRLGRAWRRADKLKEIASILVKDRKETDILQKYWDDNKAAKPGEPDQSPVGETPITTPGVSFPADLPKHNRKTATGTTTTRARSASDGASLAPPDQKLSPYHPAWSLASLLDRFGPLIFPIHRAALLRKRILISCHAPVHQVCDFVYNISILSNIPLSLQPLLPPSSPTQRLRPLFTIGVHDIPFLMEDFEASKRQTPSDNATDDIPEAGSGWVACTTDSILAMKDTLWDMLITIPPEHSANAKEKVWPIVECPRGKPIKATQRDLRRFNALLTGLARLAQQDTAFPTSPNPETPRTRRPSASHSARTRTDDQGDAVEKLVEPLTWSAFAYNGFMWWASAGEQLRSEEQEESARDAALLADLAPASAVQTPMTMPQPTSRSDPLSDSLASLTTRRAHEGGSARVELAIIAYFHRLTTQMLSVLVDIVEGADEVYSDSPQESQATQGHRDGADTPQDNDALLRDGGISEGDDDEEEEDDDQDLNSRVTVDSRSVENMGLDVWSATDAEFVQDLVATYFGREARIEGKGVEVCGVRVC